MAALSAALALLSGAIGAGFASGREILRFFASHGAMAGAAIVCALMMLAFSFLRLPAQMERSGCASLADLCRLRFGERLGRLCAALFFLLFSITGGAMLAACAELAALTMNVRHAYAGGMIASLLLAALLARRGISGLVPIGALLLLLLPAMMLRLLSLPAGEACFLPAMAPDLPVRAALEGTAYGALNAAMLAGALPMLLSLAPTARRRSVAVFSALFGVLLLLGTAVCKRHMPSILHQAMPFVYLSRALGPGGYFLVAACLYAASFSTLLAMLAGLRRMTGKAHGAYLPPLCCLLAALVGFGPLVKSAYPVLGALCAGLLLLLCFSPCGREAPQRT